MARKGRIHVPVVACHVMIRGNVGQYIFYSDQDHYRFYQRCRNAEYRNKTIDYKDQWGDEDCQHCEPILELFNIK